MFRAIIVMCFPLRAVLLQSRVRLGLRNVVSFSFWGVLLKNLINRIVVLTIPAQPAPPPPPKIIIGCIGLILNQLNIKIYIISKLFSYNISRPCNYYRYNKICIWPLTIHFHQSNQRRGLSHQVTRCTFSMGNVVQVWQYFNTYNITN